MIRPPLTVTRTCTGPYWVCAASPVSTCVPCPAPPSPRPRPPEPESAPLDSCAAGPAAAAALSRADWRDFTYPALV